MVQSVTKLPENVSVQTFRTNKKGESETIALLRLDGRPLPILVIGQSNEEARSKAENVFLHNFNSVKDFSFLDLDETEIQSRIVSTFTGEAYKKPDRRAELKDTVWVSRFVEGNVKPERKRIARSELQSYLDQGFIDARDPDIATRKAERLANRANRTDGRSISKLKDLRWLVNAAGQRTHVHKDRVLSLMNMGWTVGRGEKGAETIVLAEDAQAVETASVE